MTSILDRIDQGLFQLIQTSRTPMTDALSLGVSWLGDYGLIWLALVVLLFCMRRAHWRAGLALLAGVTISGIVTEFLMKPIIHAPRPLAVLPNLETLGQIPTTAAFPSGHVASATTAAWILGVHFPRWRWFWAFVPFLMGWSRLVNGVHWPSDILGGLLVGTLVGWLAVRFILDPRPA